MSGKDEAIPTPAIKGCCFDLIVKKITYKKKEAFSVRWHGVLFILEQGCLSVESKTAFSDRYQKATPFSKTVKEVVVLKGFVFLRSEQLPCGKLNVFQKKTDT